MREYDLVTGRPLQNGSEAVETLADDELETELTIALLRSGKPRTPVRPTPARAAKQTRRLRATARRPRRERPVTLPADIAMPIDRTPGGDDDPFAAERGGAGVEEQVVPDEPEYVRCVQCDREIDEAEAQAQRWGYSFQSSASSIRSALTAPAASSVPSPAPALAVSYVRVGEAGEH